MEKFATLAGFTTKASATTNLCKVLKKVLGKDSAASPECGKEAGGRKRKAGTYFGWISRDAWRFADNISNSCHGQ
jgi:hypothetical protein